MGKEEFLKEIRRQISAEQLKLNKRLTAFATAKQSGNVEAISVAEEHVNVSSYFPLIILYKISLISMFYIVFLVLLL
jgi:hypothetical protein